MNEDYRQHLFTSELSITALISLFYQKSPRNFNFAGERHDFWEFIYIDKGQIKIIAGDQPYILKAGELAFHRPGEFHAVYAHENIPANFIVCAFTCTSEIMRYFEQKILFLSGTARECLYAAVRETCGNLKPVTIPDAQVLTIEEAPFGAGQLIRSYLEQMLILLYRQDNTVKIQQRVESFAQINRYRQMTATILAYLEQHLDERLTLAQIAKDLGYGTSQMKKLFKAETGRSIIDTFISMKMDEARRMIQEGNLNFTQIAGQLGFDSPQYFSRLFKSQNRMTPTEYSRSIG